MSQLDLTRVHVYKRRTSSDGQTGEILAEVNPAMAISSGSYPPVWLQHGRFWAAGGDGIDPAGLPDWFWGEVRKVTPEALKLHGFDACPEPPKPELPEVSIQEEVAQPKPSEPPQAPEVALAEAAASKARK